MSYAIYLNDPITKECLLLDSKHHMRGGTYCVGGEDRAKLNITYNYAKHFYRVFDKEPDTKGLGVRTIYGMTGAESIPVLKAAIAQLGDDVNEDYWAATEGNAKRSLLQLVALATMRPDGVWDGD
jgi:hypothetical protein